MKIRRLKWPNSKERRATQAAKESESAPAHLLENLKGCPPGFRVQVGAPFFLAVGRFILGEEFDPRSKVIELGEEFNGARVERCALLKGFVSHGVRS